MTEPKNMKHAPSQSPEKSEYGNSPPCRDLPMHIGISNKYDTLSGSTIEEFSNFQEVNNKNKKKRTIKNLAGGSSDSKRGVGSSEINDQHLVKRKCGEGLSQSSAFHQTIKEVNINRYFSIHPRRKFNYPSNKISRPIYLGDYSVDGSRKFHHDSRNLRHINMNWKDSKEVEYDLNIGLDKCIRKHPDTSKTEKLQYLMSWLTLNSQKLCEKEKVDDGKTRLAVDFICFRGLLTTLLCTPYETNDGWIICASKFRGTIYMFAYDTPEKTSQKLNRTEREEAMCSWGFKFEQYMNGEDINMPVNENDEYMCVVQTTLGGFKLLYSPEVDGFDNNCKDRAKQDLRDAVELKTSKEPVHPKDHRNLAKFKFIKWWCQSYLAGIPRLVCGFRDQEGVVRRLKTYAVDSFPIRAQEYWQSNILLNFVTEFLQHVKSIVTVDDPRHVYKFKREINGEKITCTHFTQPTEWNIIPDWYIDKL